MLNSKLSSADRRLSTTIGFAVAAASVMLCGVLFGRCTAQELGASFSIHRGVNVAGPFVRVRSVSQNEEGQISEFHGVKMYPNWYTGEELQSAGFDFIRLPLNPAPLLENPPAVRAHLLDEVEKSMCLYIHARLRVVLDLQFWVPENKTWTALAVMSDANGTSFAAYRALVGEISLRLARYTHGEVAFELLNEPPALNCYTSGWIVRQQMLLLEVRKHAPTLPVVVSGCRGQLDELLALNSSNINIADKNLNFSFHFYEPFFFTHQGFPMDPRLRYLDGVPYPASTGSRNVTLDETNRTIDGSGLSSPALSTAKELARKNINDYYSWAPDRSSIEKRFDEVMTWAKTNGIPPSRILLGEFAAINWRKSDTPAYLDARRTWDEDVRSAAEKRGISSAFWNLAYPKGPLFR